MADLATAYIRLIPSLRGSKRAIESELAGIDGAGAGSSVGASFGSGLLGGIGDIAIGSALGNMLTSAVSKAADAATDAFRQSFANVGTFEQLEGGIEKIFDQANTEQIFQDAQNAYKELNVSANDYLASVSQVGATFAQTMGDQAGYDTARKGMLAIADFASGTGLSIDELNEKYKLITRSAGSYQSIADQFAGILPQTSAGFLEAAQAAGLVSEQYTELTDVPVDEYQRAVTAMLERGVADLGLTSNALNESTETLTGSIEMTKASWQNLLTEVGKPDGDVSTRVQEFVDSVSALARNAMPVVEQILSGMGAAISQFAQTAGAYFVEHRTEIYDKVGEWIGAALEAIATATPYILEGIVYLLGSLVEYVIDHRAEMLDAALGLVLTLADSFASAHAAVLDAMSELCQNIVDGVGAWWSEVYNAGVDLILGLAQGIASAPGAVADAVTAAVGGAIEAAKRMLGIASPSRVFAEIGRYSMLGLEGGIAGELGGVRSTMRLVGDALSLQPAVQSGPARTLASGFEVSDGAYARDGRDMTVILELDRTQLGRTVYRLNADETQRVGVSLAGGYA